MKEDTLKYKGKFEKLWIDPVWSKVISAAIISIVTIVYSIAKTIFNGISLSEAIAAILNFQIPVYTYLIFSLVSIAIYYLINFFRKKYNNTRLGFDLDQRIGDFTFRELHNALLTHLIKVPSNLSTFNGPKNIDLLVIFKIYARIFNQGVQWEDDFDSYYKIGPTLMSYGIVEKVPSTKKTDDLGLEMLQTSKIGYQFLAMLEKWRVYNNEPFHENQSEVISHISKEKKS